MIDLHTHLLPGVDDGARELAQSAAVLAAFAAAGVTVVACTPHLRASAVRASGPPAPHAARLAALQAAAPVGLTLVHGWEVMLDEPGADLACGALCVGGGPALLVELPRGPSLPPNVDAELARLAAAGVRPVVAHPERYPGLTPAIAAGWRAAGAALQGTAGALALPGRRGAAARALLAAGQLDLLASDNHGDARSLAEARGLLRDAGAEGAADVLTRENPGRLLRGAPLLAAPRVALRGPGVWARLRRLAGRPSPAAVA